MPYYIISKGALSTKGAGLFEVVHFLQNDKSRFESLLKNYSGQKVVCIFYGNQLMMFLY